jgi:hypothetical protein
MNMKKVKKEILNTSTPTDKIPLTTSCNELEIQAQQWYINLGKNPKKKEIELRKMFLNSINCYAEKNTVTLEQLKSIEWGIMLGIKVAKLHWNKAYFSDLFSTPTEEELLLDVTARKEANLISINNRHDLTKGGLFKMSNLCLRYIGENAVNCELYIYEGGVIYAGCRESCTEYAVATLLS